MKLPPARTRAFLENPAPQAQAALVYGPNSGLVTQRAEQIVARVLQGVPNPMQDAFAFAELEADAVVSDPARFYEEMTVLNLMGGPRLVRIRHAGDKLAPILKAFFASHTPEAWLLLTAGELKKDGGLRKWAEDEKNRHALALACYDDDEQTLSDVLAALLKQNGCTLEPDARAFLSDLFAGVDRGVVKSELEKLALYTGASSPVTLADARAVLDTSGRDRVDAWTFALLEGKPHEALAAWQELMQEGNIPRPLIRLLGTQLERLERIRAAMAGGASAEAAVKGLRPAVFFKHEARVTAHARRWTPERLAAAWQHLLNTEAAASIHAPVGAAVVGRELAFGLLSAVGEGERIPGADRLSAPRG